MMGNYGVGRVEIVSGWHKQGVSCHARNLAEVKCVLWIHHLNESRIQAMDRMSRSQTSTRTRCSASHGEKNSDEDPAALIGGELRQREPPSPGRYWVVPQILGTWGFSGPPLPVCPSQAIRQRPRSGWSGSSRDPTARSAPAAAPPNRHVPLPS